MDSDEVAFSGVAGQRSMLDDRSLKARTLVEASLGRIARHNPRLNAFVSVRADAALREADQAQLALDHGDSRPLLGIPFAVKDEHDLAGEVTSYGTAATAILAERDCELVHRLRQAGAIPVGKTTLPELGMHPFTESVTFGVTRNPWNRSRTPGGSSGGSAAAVAAGLVPFATAGDGGGSIRIPASCCNLFGLKVQRDRVTMSPHVDPPGGLSVFGVLTRGVADAALLYELLIDASTAPAEGSGWAHSLSEAAALGPGRLRIGMTFGLGMRASPAREVEQGTRRFAEVLAGLGHRVTEISIDPGRWLLAFTALGTHLLVEEARTLEMPARLERRTRAVLHTGVIVNDRAVRWATGRQQHVATRTNRVFDDVDLVLTPTVAQSPPDATTWSGMGTLRTSRNVAHWCPYTSLWSFLGQPAANVPAGFNHSGLPIGAQLLAPPNGESLLVAVAAQLERELRWTDARPPC